MTEHEHMATRDDWGVIDPAFLARIVEALDGGEPRAVRQLTRDLHAADLADVIEALGQDDRVRLITALGRGFDAAALAELDEGVRDELMEALPNEVIASAIKKLDTDDALYLIEDLERDDQREILARVPREDRAALTRALDYPEDTAGRLMKTEFVAVPDTWTVGQATQFVRSSKDLPDQFIEVYVVDEAKRLVGTVPLSRLLRAPDDRQIDAIMDTEQTVFRAGDAQDDVAFRFDKYNLVSAAVTDDGGRLIGTLMADDIVDVIQEEAAGQLLHLGGVGVEEAIGNSVAATTRSRFAWLFVNLLTAVLASWVISLFGATIEQMVALAVLMPIVASMGGNAGTQSMTVAVRALATRTLSPVNALRFTLRECAVGLINGLLFALIVGVFAWAWFGSDTLGLIIGAAMVINLLAAALAGILVPLALDRFDIDPAVASGTFVTTVTDVVGFFAFLGLAAIWLSAR
ncbi:magnesium transporter [Aestuariivirga sp.]|jgi:magnesium transporter|uniref:magnesium transporter n=1 Tax=Aestuariivirga sp. TaxID=2650926 RepID=UPI00378447F0